MLLIDKEFPKSTTYFDKHAELHAIAGYSSWFTEFKPVRFPCIEQFHQLLFLFLRQRLCFFFAGPFVLYIGGFVHSFQTMSFYILNEYHPTLRKIFQICEILIPHFQLGSFQFQLFHVLDDFGSYHMRCDDFEITVKFYGVDADDSLFCDFRSNVDFVHFVWENYDKFPIQKFAITILPQDNAPVPFCLEDTRMLYLKHYRALGDG